MIAQNKDNDCIVISLHNRTAGADNECASVLKSRLPQIMQDSQNEAAVDSIFISNHLAAAGRSSLLFKNDVSRIS